MHMFIGSIIMLLQSSQSSLSCCIVNLYLLEAALHKSKFVSRKCRGIKLPCHFHDACITPTLLPCACIYTCRCVWFYCSSLASRKCLKILSVFAPQTDSLTFSTIISIVYAQFLLTCVYTRTRSHNKFGVDFDVTKCYPTR